MTAAWLEKVLRQARAEIAGGFNEDTDREKAVEDYINGMTNFELLELIDRAHN